VNDKGNEVTSSVIRTVDGFYDEGLLIPHEVIRRYMIDAEAFLPCIKGGQDWKVCIFYKWYKEIFHFYVHHHHDAEEKIYFPWMNTKAKIPESTAAEHKELFEWLDKIADTEAEVKAQVAAADGGTEVAAVQELSKKWVQMKSMMFDHLSSEETFTPGILKEHFTQAQEAAVVQKIMKQLGIKGARIMVPPIVEAMKKWSGEEGAAAFVGALPPPLRFFLKMFWMPAFLKTQEELRSIMGDEPPPSKRGGCLC